MRRLTLQSLFEVLNHSLFTPYSPDLVPRDIFLFPNLKIALGMQRFSSNDEAINFVKDYFSGKDTEYYLDGIKIWEHCWEKCVDLQGDYVGK